ncbi:MAG TPA: transaldolase [Acidimicrobiales bacterium]|nr:transaldolase [Acidimicrobiales bacterium]
MTVPNVNIKIFADGANLTEILSLSRNSLIKGFTTNPTLMFRSGVVDYEAFAREILEEVTTLPVSFEVIADDFNEMTRQARLLASWGDNVFVKIPIMTTQGVSCAPLVKALAADGLQLNVTALTTIGHVQSIAEVLNPNVPLIVSVFAGRIADTGVDPIPVMEESLKLLAPYTRAELLWASPREILNVVQAASLGCHVITVTKDLLTKLSGLHRDLELVALDTVRMFTNDAIQSGLTL